MNLDLDLGLNPNQVFFHLKIRQHMKRFKDFNNEVCFQSSGEDRAFFEANPVQVRLGV